MFRFHPLCKKLVVFDPAAHARKAPTSEISLTTAWFRNVRQTLLGDSGVSLVEIENETFFLAVEKLPRFR